MYAGKIPKSSMMGLAMDTLFSILNYTLNFYHNTNKNRANPFLFLFQNSNTFWALFSKKRIIF
jgi:hypothetical protein